MMEPETETTEQLLTEPAEQPETATLTAMETPSVAEETETSQAPAATPAAEEAPAEALSTPRDFPPLRMITPPVNAPRPMSSQEFEMAHLEAFMNQQKNERQEIPLGHPLEGRNEEPLVTLTADVSSQNSEAQEAYWRKVLTGNPDSIPEDLRRRAGCDDLSVPSEERDYRLLNAVNRSWLADHSDLSRDDIEAQWPELRSALCREHGVEDDEQQLFTALSVAPEAKAQQERALSLCRDAYNAALMKQPHPDVTSQEDFSMSPAAVEEAYRSGKAQQERLQPLVKNMSSLLSAFNALESATPADLYTLLSQMPELGRTFEQVLEMDKDSRRDLYAMTLQHMQEHHETEAPPSSLMLAMAKSVRRGGYTLRLDLTQALGQGVAVAADVASRIPGAEKVQAVSKAVDARLMLFRELAEMAKTEVNPLHEEGESYLRQLSLDASETIAPATVAAVSGGVALTAGLGSALAEARQRAEDGSITLQTAAGMMALAAQHTALSLFNRYGGKMAQGMWKKMIPVQWPQSVAGKVAAYGAKGVKKFAGGAATYQVIDFSNKAMQEGASRLEGIDSNIDWETQWKQLASPEHNFSEAVRNLPYVVIGAKRPPFSHFRHPLGPDGKGGGPKGAGAKTLSPVDWNAQWKSLSEMENDCYEAVRNLPFVLIGARRASLSYFRQPWELVADGPRLTEWGVPEETQQRLREETDPTRRNNLLADALNKSDFRGSEDYMNKAKDALSLLPTGENDPFRNEETLRDFLNLPPQTETERTLAELGGNKKPEPAEKDPLGRGTQQPSSRRLLKLRLITDEWQQRAFPEELPGYLRTEDLMPEQLSLLGNHTQQADKARMEAVGKTIRYLDALTYRILLNTTSYNALHQAGKQPAAVREMATAMRQELFGKVAEAVVSRAAGESPAHADEVIGSYMTNHYLNLRNERAVNSWLKQIELRRLEKLHHAAFNRRAMERGAEYRRGKFLELQEAHWMAQGLRSGVHALTGLLSSHSDFQTALSRGMTPQEAMTHLLKRELGDRLSGEAWKEPIPETLNITDKEVLLRENQRLSDTYIRLTGRIPESRKDDDGKTYWRIQLPDGHYSHWHDSAENCLNDLVANGRLRFLQLGIPPVEAVQTSTKNQQSFDAAQLGMKRPHSYSYYDRLSALSTGDLTRFWQEDATLTVPGTIIEMFRNSTSEKEPFLGGYVREHPDFPGMWRVDARNVRSPYGLARGRFESYWLNQLSSGWLTPEDAAGFLVRRGVIDEAESKSILEMKTKLIRPHASIVTPERFFSDNYHNLPQPYYDIAGMNGRLARHLTNYTSGYFLAHMNEMPLPPSVREWFALTPFRLNMALYNGKRRVQPGHNDTVQTEKWAHQHDSVQVQNLLVQAEKIRGEESGENNLLQDPLFPMLRQAILPEPARRAEQGWGYSLGGTDTFLRVRPEHWNLMLSPVRGWELLDDDARSRVRQAVPFRPGEKRPAPVESTPPAEGAEPRPQQTEPVPLPKALEELDAVLRDYPELHEYELHPEDESRVIHLEIPPVRGREYRRRDGPYDQPPHTGEQVISAGFKLREVDTLPQHLLADERVIPALKTLAALRRSAHTLPYADAQGVWWNGELYGGKNGKKLVGMDDTWYADEPLRNIRRIFAEMPEDGSPVMTFDNGLIFARRDPLPEDAFRSTTVFRSDYYPLSQVRLMPGEHTAAWENVRHPYVTHSFIGSPMYNGVIIANNDTFGFYSTPLERFTGDVTREMIGHMAGWWGKKATENALDALMARTENEEALYNSRYEHVSNREILMQLSEDLRFSASLEGRSPQELNAEEALAAMWIHSLAEYECGVNPEKSGEDLLKFHQYFLAHPERLDAVHKMLDDHRVWYAQDPTDQWYHVVTTTPEIRRAKQLQREREHEAWKQKLQMLLGAEEAQRFDRINRRRRDQKDDE